MRCIGCRGLGAEGFLRIAEGELRRICTAGAAVDYITEAMRMLTVNTAGCSGGVYLGSPFSAGGDDCGIGQLPEDSISSGGEEILRRICEKLLS